MYNFISDVEKKISIEFETKGYIIKKIPKKFFNEIEKEFVNFIKKKLKIKKNYNNSFLLNNFHKFLKSDDLNKFRVNLISHINKSFRFKKIST